MHILIKSLILGHKVLNQTNYSIKLFHINKTIKIFNIKTNDL